jgi:hypothetical protein
MRELEDGALHPISLQKVIDGKTVFFLTKTLMKLLHIERKWS